jgi:hypothetical protein
LIRQSLAAAVALLGFGVSALADDRFMTIRTPVNPGDTLLEAISADPMEYVKLTDQPNVLAVKLYGKGCSKVVGFSETEIYNYRVCPNGTATVTDGSN